MARAGARHCWQADGLLGRCSQQTINTTTGHAQGEIQFILLDRGFTDPQSGDPRSGLTGRVSARKPQ